MTRSPTRRQPFERPEPVTVPAGALTVVHVRGVYTEDGQVIIGGQTYPMFPPRITVEGRVFWFDDSYGGDATYYAEEPPSDAAA